MHRENKSNYSYMDFNIYDGKLFRILRLNLARDFKLTGETVGF